MFNDLSTSTKHAMAAGLLVVVPLSALPLAYLEEQTRKEIAAGIADGRIPFAIKAEDGTTLDISTYAALQVQLDALAQNRKRVTFEIGNPHQASFCQFSILAIEAKDIALGALFDPSRPESSRLDLIKDLNNHCSTARIRKHMQAVEPRGPYSVVSPDGRAVMAQLSAAPTAQSKS